MTRAFDYATIGFRPYSETGEFVTVGVIAFEPKTRRMGYELLSAKKSARIRGLFPRLERQIFTLAMEQLRGEMQAVAAALTPEKGADVPYFAAMLEDQAGIFQSITSPREGMFFFPKKGRRLAADMDEALAILRLRFIDQNLVEAVPAVEGEMARHLKALLRREKVLAAYEKDVRLGPDEFHVFFPLVHFTKVEKKADRAIRPLNFDLTNSTDIFNHGDEWTQRLRRLDKLGHRPERCLIALKAPGEEDATRMNAFLEIRKEFQGLGVELADELDHANILGFARIPEEKNLKLHA